MALSRICQPSLIILWLLLVEMVPRHTGSLPLLWAAFQTCTVAIGDSLGCANHDGAVRSIKTASWHCFRKSSKRSAWTRSLISLMKYLYTILMAAALGGLVVSGAISAPRPPKPGSTPTTSRPLTIAELNLTRGTGSACRYGCDEPNTPCTPVYTLTFIPDPDGGGTWVEVLTGYARQIWTGHFECAFALGGDNCVPLHDTTCNIIYHWGTNQSTCPDGYGTFAGSDVTTSALCSEPNQGGG